ncbi:MAG: hypothetical protein ASARMPREDX12_007769 [Alectoria sarmentosa]|nr:MAG: hypothetical protein ASARMPREDX12_007769 [Alectoria sarmentosa]
MLCIIGKRPDESYECFTVDPLDEKLLNVDLASVKSFSKELLYDLRLSWEALCAENVHEDNFPRFVLLIKAMSPKPLRGKRLSEIKLSRTFNGRTLLAPIVAFTMAGLLFVYTRSSIHAAKRNAERHRAADGGEISWYNESQRRHGALEKPKEQDSIKQLITGSHGKIGKVLGKEDRQSVEEAVLRARKGERDNGG